MPLIGRAAAVPGGEAAAGPIGLAVAGLTAFAAVLNSATQTVGEFRRAATVSGGTAGDVARLGAMGVAPGQVGQASAELRERLVTDSRSQAAAQRIGLQLPGHRLAGNVNEAQVLRQALERLRVLGKMEGAERQLFEARELGLEGMLDQLRVSDRVWAAQKRGADLQGEIMKRNADQFRDFAAQGDRVSMAFDSLKVALGALVVKDAERSLNQVANYLSFITEILDKLKPPESKWDETLRRLEEKQNQKDTATEKNTAALEANTQLTREGMFGGGPRAAGAVPTHLRGELLAENLKTQKFNLGVFGN